MSGVPLSVLEPLVPLFNRLYKRLATDDETPTLVPIDCDEIGDEDFVLVNDRKADPATAFMVWHDGGYLFEWIDFDDGRLTAEDLADALATGRDELTGTYPTLLITPRNRLHRQLVRVATVVALLGRT